MLPFFNKKNLHLSSLFQLFDSFPRTDIQVYTCYEKLFWSWNINLPQGLQFIIAYSCLMWLKFTSVEAFYFFFLSQTSYVHNGQWEKIVTTPLKFSAHTQTQNFNSTGKLMLSVLLLKVICCQCYNYLFSMLYIMIKKEKRICFPHIVFVLIYICSFFCISFYFFYEMPYCQINILAASNTRL